MDRIQQIIEELCAYDSEREWFEFKENWFKADELGKYISALSNSAAIAGKNMVTLSGESMMSLIKLSEPILTVIGM